MNEKEPSEFAADLADCNAINPDIVEFVRAKQHSDECYYNLADFFKVFGDSTRVRILSALDTHEMCVCDLANVLNMTKSAVSHQLRVLRQSDLVRARRDGKSMIYALADDHVQSIFELAMEHIHEE